MLYLILSNNEKLLLHNTYSKSLYTSEQSSGNNMVLYKVNGWHTEVKVKFELYKRAQIAKNSVIINKHWLWCPIQESNLKINNYHQDWIKIVNFTKNNVEIYQELLLDKLNNFGPYCFFLHHLHFPSHYLPNLSNFLSLLSVYTNKWRNQE